MYPVGYFHNVGFRERIDEPDLTSRDYFFDSVDLVLRDQPYNVRSGRKYIISRYGVLTLENMADEAALCKQVMRSGAQGFLFCYALQSVHRYKMLSWAREEEDGDSDGGESIATKEVVGAKRIILDVDGVLLRDTGKVGNMITITLSQKVHHVTACEQAVHFR